MNGNILLLQVQEPELARIERDAIWHQLGTTTAYFNLPELASATIEVERYSHVILTAHEAHLCQTIPTWVATARAVIRACDRLNIPFLGIEAGMQLLAHSYGARLAAEAGETGQVQLHTRFHHPFFGFLPERLLVHTWHTESVVSLPGNFLNLGSSATCPIQMICHDSKPLFGVQFHPALDLAALKAQGGSTQSAQTSGPLSCLLPRFCRLSTYQRHLTLNPPLLAGKAA